MLDQRVKEVGDIGEAVSIGRLSPRLGRTMFQEIGEYR
jgi:hypothetical protein